MVEQVLAHRPLGHDFYAEAFQQAPRPDARALQDRRRVDRASRQDHLAPRPYRFALAAYLYADAFGMGAIAFEGERVDHGIADDRQVGAVARRFEVTVIDRNAQALSAVDRVGRHAGSLRRVVVVAPAVAQRHRRFHQSAVDVAPLLDGRAIDRDRAALAVIRRIAEIDIAFQPAEVRQDLLPAPALGAVGDPVFEVLWNAADGDLAVDGRAAADRAPAPQQLGLLPFRPAGQKLGPAIVVVGDGAQRIGDPQMLRRVDGAEVVAGLEQQDAQRGVLAQPCRQDGAGRAAADDDEVVIVLHCSSSLARFAVKSNALKLRSLPWPPTSWKSMPRDYGRAWSGRRRSGAFARSACAGWPCRPRTRRCAISSSIGQRRQAAASRSIASATSSPAAPAAIPPCRRWRSAVIS